MAALLTPFVLLAIAIAAPAALARAEECSGITGTAVYEGTSGVQDRSVPLGFTAVWAKRSNGLPFVSWQSTGVPE